MSRLVLPAKYRRRLVQATVGGGAAGFTTLGPNAPGGMVSPYTDFLGNVLPARTYPITSNAHGMGGLPSQTRQIELVDDAAGPSGKALRINFPGKNSARAGVAWPPPDFGGGSPSARFTMRNELYVPGTRLWKKLYLHHWYRIGPTFSFAAEGLTATTLFTGVGTAGSTTTVLFDSSKSWTPGALVGAYVKRSSQGSGAVIIANTETALGVSDNDRFDFAPNGEAYTVYTVAPNGNTGTQSTYKGWFWPRQVGRLFGSSATPGGGGPLGGTWSLDTIATWAENHYMGTFVGGTAPGLLWEGFGCQVSKTWESPYSLDGNGLPIWNMGGRFNQYPSPGTAIAYTPGDLVKAEYFLQMNTPGIANGVYRVWHNGGSTPVVDRNDVMFTEKYVSALAVEGAGGPSRPVLAGSPRDVAYEVTDAYWSYLYHDWAYGGGTRVPLVDGWVQSLALAVSGAP